MNDPNKTVKEIVEEYLKSNGFDGLFQEDGECACDLKDLMPCGDFGGSCEAGYKVECEEDSDFDFLIGRNKEE